MALLAISKGFIIEFRFNDYQESKVWYCFTKALRGSFRMDKTSPSITKSRRIGRCPITGIIPNFWISSATFLACRAWFINGFIVLPKPMTFFTKTQLFHHFFDPSKASTYDEENILYPLGSISCWGLRPLRWNTSWFAPFDFKRACCTLTRTSRVIETFSLFLRILSISST